MLSVTDKQCFDMCLRMSREEAAHRRELGAQHARRGGAQRAVRPGRGDRRRPAGSGHHLSKIYSPEWRRSKDRGGRGVRERERRRAERPRERDLGARRGGERGGREGGGDERRRNGRRRLDPQAEVNVERRGGAGMERVSPRSLARPGSPTPSLEALTELTDGGSVEGGGRQARGRAGGTGGHLNGDGCLTKSGKVGREGRDRNKRVVERCARPRPWGSKFGRGAHDRLMTTRKQCAFYVMFF